MRAFTLWSLFGAWNWNSLLTRQEGYYESGCFDVSNGVPQETLLAAWVRARAAGVAFVHPALAAQGWWRSPSRIHRTEERYRVVTNSSPFIEMGASELEAAIQLQWLDYWPCCFFAE